MTPEELSRIRGIFEQALSMNPSDRDTFIRRECQDREDLQSEVERLLRARVPTWMEQPVWGAAGAFDPPPVPRLEGHNIAGYTVVREIGRGGMGVVYLAERSDETFHRRVAIKLLPAAGSGDIIARFQQEIRILASLDHPHIAKLLDAGATKEGWPYFVMEFVEGQPIDRWCDERKLNISQRVELFRSVIDAVEYAHRHLVVHRDLKPGNIFVTGEGVVKLLDFGIAKVISGPLDGEAETLTLARMMTLGYASPEQVNGSAITTQSDVYSLGVVLYELLTGHKPYHLASAAAHEISRVIAEVEPARPSDVVTRSERTSAGDRMEVTPEQLSATREGDPNRLRKRLVGDLDAIVMMALRKEPERRYGSVASLADDLQRHLEQRTIRAREASLWERFGRFRHRNFGGFAVGGVIVLLISFGVASVVVQLRHDIEAAERSPGLDPFPLSFWLFGLGLAMCAAGTSVYFARITGAMPRMGAPGGKPLRFAGIVGGFIWAAASTLTWSIGRSHGWWSSRISGQPDPLWLVKPPDFGTCVGFGLAAIWTLYMTGRRFGRLAQLAGLVLLGLGKALADRLLFGKVIPALTFAPGAVPFWFSAVGSAGAAWIGLFIIRLAARRELRRKENL